MDRFAIFALTWLACAVISTLIGMVRGRSADALTLGVLLGPLGVVLTIAFIGYRRTQEGPRILKISDATPTPRLAAREVESRRRAA
jgi:hypothetical protein